MQAVAKTPELAFESAMLDEHMHLLSGDTPLAKFGLTGLNEVLGGIYPGQNIVIGATPGSGKTSLISQEADHLAADGHPVIFVSGELPPHKLVAKSLSRLSDGGLDLSEVAAASLPAHPKHEALERALAEYRERIAPNLCITGFLNLADLGCLVGACIRERGRAPILFLDYLQLLATAGAADAFVDERLAISAYVKGIRDISNCYGTPVCVLSTITRTSYNAKKPGIGLFGGAASIEYSFDAALYLTDDEEQCFPQDGPHGEPVKLVALKNRYGALGYAPLSFDGAHATFRDRG